MTSPSGGVWLASQTGQWPALMSPLTAGWPVTSIQVAALSVVFAPLVTVQVASVVLAVVPATTQANTRSLPKEGAVNWRTSAPAATALFCGRLATAK